MGTCNGIVQYEVKLGAKCFQHEEYEGVFALVAKMTTSRTLMVVANRRNLILRQLNVKTTFLNENLNK